MSEYNRKIADKKYDEKRKKVACTIMNDEYDKLIKHIKEKGFTSVNSYILDLIRKDMNKDT